LGSLVKRFLRPLPVAVGVAVLALVALLIYGVVAKDADTGIEDALARGERPAAPEVTLPKLEGGGEGGLADYRGQVVVLNYWASWCDPCRDESPLLQRWHERLSKSDGTVLGIDVLDVTDDAKEFIDEYGLEYPMLKDADGSTQKEFGIVGYPETFVVDRDGRIAAAKRGPVDEAWLEENVAPLVEEQA
jgi:cytochrome c biogenesis protein CcmG, thiol:disulfide interchange protein DsbE